MFRIIGNCCGGSKLLILEGLKALFRATRLADTSKSSWASTDQVTVRNGHQPYTSCNYNHQTPESLQSNQSTGRNHEGVYKGI